MNQKPTTMDTNHKMDQKSVKVNCSFCNNEMECPESMLENSKKHMCHQCFQDPKNLENEDLETLHIDIPMDEFNDNVASGFADKLVEEEFPKVWLDNKEDLKDLSKKELGEEMFEVGVYFGIKAFLESMHQVDKKMAEKYNSQKINSAK